MKNEAVGKFIRICSSREMLSLIEGRSWIFEISVSEEGSGVIGGVDLEKFVIFIDELPDRFEKLVELSNAFSEIGKYVWEMQLFLALEPNKVIVRNAEVAKNRFIVGTVIKNVFKCRGRGYCITTNYFTKKVMSTKSTFSVEKKFCFSCATFSRGRQFNKIIRKIKIIQKKYTDEKFTGS